MSEENKSTKVTEFNYELSEPIQYAHNGNPVEASFITFKAPSSKQIDLCADLKQYFFQALKEGEELSAGKAVGNADNKDLELTGSDIMSLLSMSTKVKLRSVILTAKQLFKVKGIAMLDGSVNINELHFNEMDPDEIQDMIGEYLVNFILASVLKKMKQDL